MAGFASPSLHRPRHPTGADTRPDRAAAARACAPQAREPLTDRRFHSLMDVARDFFASFERDVEAEKAAAITEIQALLEQHGLNLEDLADPGK